MMEEGRRVSSPSHHALAWVNAWVFAAKRAVRVVRAG